MKYFYFDHLNQAEKIFFKHFLFKQNLKWHKYMSYLQSIINNNHRSDVIEGLEQKIVYLKRREHALFCATVALLQVQTSDFAKKVVHFSNLSFNHSVHV